MKRQQEQQMEIEPVTAEISSPLVIPQPDDIEEAVEIGQEEPDNHPNFIESNTSAITLEDLSDNCIVPTFADNTLTVSHQSFIQSVMEAGQSIFGDLTPVECRVSHPINGRTPDALHKQAHELLDSEKTIYYQRLAFISHVTGLSRTINDQPVLLTIGGVRAYNEDRLFGRSCPLKYKIFVGWTVRVCSNLCLQCDGLAGNIECMTASDIKEKAESLFSSFDQTKDDNLLTLENLGRTRINEGQFCSIIGRLRLYQNLSTASKSELNLPQVILGDQTVNAAVRNYVENPNFRKEEGADSISLWQLLQLLNEAVKASYIDKWLERNQNCTDFVFGIEKAILGESQEYAWFLK